MKTHRIAALLLALVAAGPAWSQALIGSGHVIGNGTAASRAPTDTTMTAILDRAWCATNGDIAVRLSGTWKCSVGFTLDGSGNVTGGAYNKITVTAPATGATLTIADGKTLTANSSATIAGTDGKTLTLTNSGTLAGGDGFTLAIGAGKTLTASASLTLAGTDGKTLTVNNSGTISGGDAFTLAIAAGKTLTASNSGTLAGGDGFTLAIAAAKTLTASASGTLAGGDGYTLAIAAAKTLTANSTLTLAGTDGKTLTVNNSGTLGGADGWTLAIAASKTLTVSNSLQFTGTDGTSFAFPGTSDTVVTLSAVQSLSNKTLTAPTINGGTATALTGLGIRSTGTGAFDLTLNNTENLTAGRTLTVTVNNANRVLNLSGNLTTGSDFTTSGAFAITLTATGATSVTLPTSGTLVNTSVTALASLGTVGTIGTGVWQGTTIAAGFGGTGATSLGSEFTVSGGVFHVATNGITNSLSAQMAAATIKGNSTASLANAADFTISGLTALTGPDANLDFLMVLDHVTGTFKKSTPGQIASSAVAGVSSVNGATGTLSLAGGTGITISTVGTAITASLTTARQTLPTTQIFLSGSGTYTLPTNALWIEVTLIGAGGGGSGPNGGGTVGGTGGDTCWRASGAACTSPLYDANGGAGGVINGNGGAGGALTGSASCTQSIIGGAGGSSTANTSVSAAGGGGGNSTLGGGASGGYNPGGGGTGAANTGGGGGGAAGGSAGSGSGGGAGGTCYILITSPASSYTYAVGAAGAAGTGSPAGGAGAAGVIVVKEHYGT